MRCLCAISGDYRTTRWLKAIGLILNFLFINTLLAIQYFDDSTCIARTDEQTCLSSKAMDQVRIVLQSKSLLLSLIFCAHFLQMSTMCVWIDSKEKCQLNSAASESPMATMIAASATTILAIPLQIFFILMIGQVRKFVQSMLTKQSIAKNRTASENLQIQNLAVSDMDKYETIRAKRAIVYRAARLRKMQTLIDDVTLEEEVESLRNYLLTEELSKSHKDEDVFESAAVRHRRTRRRRKPQLFPNAPQQQPLSPLGAARNHLYNQHASTHALVPVTSPREHVDLDRVDATLSETMSHYYHALMLHFKRVSHLIAASTVSTPSGTKQLTKLITKSRKGCDHMLTRLSKMPNDNERSEYLMRKFCLHILSDYHQSIAGRFFSVFIKGTVDGEIESSKLSLVCVVLLPCYMVFMALYVFLFGVSIGPRASRMWLINVCVTFLHSLLIIRPITIWAKALSLSSIVRVDIHTLHDHLEKIARIVMNRQVGYMKYANCRIQHVNAACRAARHYPKLTVSRFLMTLAGKTEMFVVSILYCPNVFLCFGCRL
jgi:hypothetical protein